ncbi:hypothetical protein ABZW18_31015 [Streptomyces sp. NPDC004647]|uniref:MerR family transcriptional regulator n=1 Tax=Streptomyces sp. NPDC004647 TaxID=3154671 RepID=UPI0033BDC37F
MGLLTIGEFARSSRLTPKALRLYDELGLLVDEGRITAEEAASHPQRSLLLRAMGAGGAFVPELELREARSGDRYLLCSDGLSAVVAAEDVYGVVGSATDPGQAVRELINLAIREGGPDNVSAVVADVVDLPGRRAAAP